MTTFDHLAQDYDAGRVGYSNDVYNLLISNGLRASHKILDIGCGTGLASKPLIDNDFNVTGVDPSEPMLAYAREHFPSSTWVKGTAEALPFGDAAFDAAISAQTLHRADRAKAVEEIVRVLKPGGMVAIWWKYLMSDDPVNLIRDGVARELNVEPPLSGLKGGFKEFYACEALHDQSVRVIPWRQPMTVQQYVQYERSRSTMHDAAGDQIHRYLEILEERVVERFGSLDAFLTISYVHYVYTAKK